MEQENSVENGSGSKKNCTDRDVGNRHRRCQGNKARFVSDHSISRRLSFFALTKLPGKKQGFSGLESPEMIFAGFLGPTGSTIAKKFANFSHDWEWPEELISWQGAPKRVIPLLQTEKMVGWPAIANRSFPALVLRVVIQLLSILELRCRVGRLVRIVK